MLGCILFTIGTLSIYTIYTTGEKSRFYASQRIKALYLASGILNRTEALRYKNIIPIKDLICKDMPDFTITTKVTPWKVSPHAQQNGKVVKVLVTYDLQGKKHTIELESIFYKKKSKDKTQDS